MEVDALIIGGGLSGVTTAHRLAKRGCSIVLVEGNQNVGLGANFANGAMLTPSQTSPWNTPGIVSTLVKSLVTKDSAVRISAKAVPSLLTWGLRFLKNSNPHLHEMHLRRLLDLALYSMDVFEEYYQGYADQFDAKKCGTIKIFRDQHSLEAQINSNRHLTEVGLEWEALTPDQTVEADPHLQALAPQLTGGIRFPADVVADSHKFCQILRDDLITSGQTVHVGCHADELLMADGTVIGARTAVGEIRAKNTILALGAKTGILAPAVARSIHVRPVKGYSLTYDMTGVNDLPTHPVVDEGMHVGIVPLNGKLRAVGIAEFAGFDDSLNPGILRQLDSIAKSVFPDLAQSIDGCKREPWAGFRAMSADALPYIGETSTKGLWVNTGHGHLGWTLAAGSAELLADLITGKPTAIDASTFAMTRSTAVSI
jgi:D-amino-acid dehydrogenase